MGSRSRGFNVEHLGEVWCYYMDPFPHSQLSASKFGHAFLEADPLKAPQCTARHMGAPEIMGAFFVGPPNKDCSILGSILGSPYLGKLPYVL